MHIHYASACGVVLKWTAPGLSETGRVEEWGWVKNVSLTIQVLLLGRHHLVRGGFANGASHIGSGELVLRRGDAIRQSLSRHFLPVASTTTSRINFRGKDSRNAYDIRRQKRRNPRWLCRNRQCQFLLLVSKQSAWNGVFKSTKNICLQFNSIKFGVYARVGFSTMDNAPIT